MTGRNGKELLSTWVSAETALSFKALARDTAGGTSAALRRIVTEAVDGRAPASPAGAGTGIQVGVRFKKPERLALAKAARSRGTSPANWVRSLVIVHLSRRPQWNAEELVMLRELSRKLGAIGNNINQLAYAMNLAVHTGDYPPDQGNVAREAAEVIRLELRRIASAVTGNFDYWGLPDAERPSPAPGAVESDNVEAKAAEAVRRGRPRKRPARFVDD